MKNQNFINGFKTEKKAKSLLGDNDLKKQLLAIGLIVILLCGCNNVQNKVNKQPTASDVKPTSSEAKPTPNGTPSKESITFDDQKQVEQLIKTYFNAIDKKDYTTVWELTSIYVKKKYPESEASKFNWGMASVKLISMKGYLPPTATSDFTWDVPANTPIVTFYVTLDIKPSSTAPGWDEGINRRFVAVVKENDRKWKINGLTTSP